MYPLFFGDMHYFSKFFCAFLRFGFLFSYKLLKKPFNGSFYVNTHLFSFVFETFLDSYG